jgi:F420-dependent oxidoreductase-like protein
MTQIGIMIEGQDGLTWPRWKRILQAAEDLGFAFVFRSDHFTNASPPEKDSLELWTSLAYAASHTSRIEFGSMVAPVTFRHPAMTARVGAQIDDLSGGRLVLGLGAGWNEREHTMFGIPFHDVPTRYAMFADALEITRLLLESDAPVSYQGAHFSLENAVLLPRPQRKTPVLIGGNGPRKTLPLAARYADEWNGVYLNAAAYRERTRRLDELASGLGRDPKQIKRSLMTRAITAPDDAALRSKLAPGSTVEQLAERGAIAGVPSQIVDHIGRLVDAGVQRFMLQWLDQDDIAGLELLARDVLPQVQAAQR